MKPLVTQERVRELFNYDPDTGQFTWKVGRGGRKSGDIAGGVHEPKKGYRRVQMVIDGRNYKAHRIVWLYVYGEWPDLIDHINGDATDNRLCNLRKATMAQNLANMKWTGRRSTQFRGVSYFANGYMAQISYKNRSLYLGRFKTAEEAHVAWCEAAKKLRGEFAKLD